MIHEQGRTRRKSFVLPDVVVNVAPSQGYNAAGVPQGAPFGGGNLTVKKHDKYITYTTRPGPLRYLPNFCDHHEYTKYYSSPSCSPTKVRQASPHHADGWYFDYTGMHADLEHSQSEVNALSALSLPANWAGEYFGLAQTDMDLNFYKLKPDLTKLSLPNFLLELDDVQKLWKQFKSNWRLWQDLVAQAAKSGDTAKTLAGNHLSYSFGIKPLLGDITAMRAILMGLLAKLEAFDKMANKVIHDDLTIESLVDTKSGTFNYGGNPQLSVRWTAVLERTKRVGVVYKCEPRSVTQGYTEIIRALFDALGFELNPRILWDAIPFSFVLDWFFDVGSWLEAHKHDTLMLPVTYKGSYVSCKQDLTIHSYFVRNPSDTITDIGRLVAPGWVTHRKRFIRMPISPSDSLFRELGWRLPTLNQAKLLFSLGTVLTH